MDSVFLDTDVILDLYIDRPPFHDVALNLFTLLKRSKTKCFTSALVIANTYYILSKAENRQYALDKIRTLRKLVSIVSVDEATIDAAVTLPHKDFEDSIQLDRALQHNIKVFITRNAAHYPKDRIRVADPGQYLSASRLAQKG